MKLIKIILFFTLYSNLVVAQGDKIRLELNPSYAMSLYSGYTLDSYPSRTTEYSSILVNSFSLSYIKLLKNRDAIKVGIGIMTTGHKASYSQNPPIYFSGRTDVLKANYIQLPIDYIFSLGHIKVELGVSGNILINKTRKIGSGEKDIFLYPVPFKPFALGLGTAIYYCTKLTGKIDLNIGLNSQYIATENQLNCGLLIGFDYVIN